MCQLEQKEKTTIRSIDNNARDDEHLTDRNIGDLETVRLVKQLLDKLLSP